MENKSESIKNIATALMKFQCSCPTIAKGNQAYGYKYADLPSIMETIKPLMLENNLAFTQLVEGDATIVGVRTYLIHTESGEFFTNFVSASVEKNCGKSMTSVQAEGSVITYLRRYSLSAILGIVTDLDTDGNNQQPQKQATTTATATRVSKEIIDTIAGITTVHELETFFKSDVSFKANKDICVLVLNRKNQLLNV
jgi:hypothetical protein